MHPPDLARYRSIRTTLAILGSCILAVVAAAAVDQTKPPDGLRDRTPDFHALSGARIVVEAGYVIERGTLLARDGVITAVGADVEVPLDARVWDMAGKTIYPGFIDAYGEAAAELSNADTGARYWNPNITPELRMDRNYKPDNQLNEKLRSQGFVARLVAPDRGIIRGASALVTMADLDGSQSILKGPVALHMQLTSSRGGNRGNYPNSPMGAVALARQAMYDAEWYDRAWRAYQADPDLPRPERSTALRTLSQYRAQKLPVIINTRNDLYFLRADAYAQEFDLNLVVAGSGDEYRRLEAIKATDRPVIVPLNFPSAPNVASPASAMNVTLQTLMHWDIAPENPGRLEKAGVEIALTSHGLRDIDKFLEHVRKAIDRGLEPEAALMALTETPASIFGLSNTLGSLEVGKAASFIVADGDLFADKKTRVIETWIDGKRFEVTPQHIADPKGKWKLTFNEPDGEVRTVEVAISGRLPRPTGTMRVPSADAPPANDPGDDDADDDDTADDESRIKFNNVQLIDANFAFTFEGRTFGARGAVTAGVTITTDADGQPIWTGTIVWPDGEQSEASAVFVSKLDSNDEPDSNRKGNAAEGKAKAPATAKGKTADDAPAKLPEKRRALYPVNAPLGAFGRLQPPPRETTVLLTNATVWTCGPRGVLENADVLIIEGKIADVGADLKAPDGATVIDATGKHITPGMIDCHSHIATDGGVNESGQAVTAEVRIGDFINSDDIHIYRQLAGGLTSSHILHGSANPIGGQCQLIKLRWGALPDEMKFEGAPPTIKFALGENVKQSNWDEPTGRYPQTRMGVEQIMHDEFAAARTYQRAWAAWNQTQTGMPPRRDLELDAIVEVLEGQRLIHCHSYRQDEILAFLRLCEQHGVKVATLQHILEGYKVADAIARHGATASAFSDWWAYKFEVYDAIPYNGALMHEVGVNVSFNSDDAELARRMNIEAAKAVKYGGVDPVEALKFVTLNPARQLRVDDRVGSLEQGKDADLVVWSGPPLSTYTRCEQTWIDGRKYFDRAADQQMQREVAAMRAALIQRVLASGERPSNAPDEDKDEDAHDFDYSCVDTFCNVCNTEHGGR